MEDGRISVWRYYLDLDTYLVQRNAALNQASAQ